MTIKRRLFFSNILMIVMPIGLTVIMLLCLVLVVLGITGTRDVQTYRNEYYFYNAMKEVDDFIEQSNITDLPGIMAEVDRMNDTYQAHGISLEIYEGETLLYPTSDDETHMTQILLSEDNDYLIVEDNNAVYSKHVGEYIFIFSSTDFSFYSQKLTNESFYFGILIFLFAVVIVFIVNRILTRSVTKRITMPIEILVSGVHELRDGNLNYRIHYEYNDEFMQVCNDFNEMAQRLSDMVMARQKDEENRRELIAGISHDLRTPLTSIKAYIEGLDKGIASTPQIQKRYFDTIKGKTEDLEHIINQLFLFSKLDVGEFPLHMERVEVGEVLHDFLCQAEGEYREKGLSFSLRNDSHKLYADIDVVQLRSVLNNILDNSVKYKINHHVKSEITYVESDGNIVISITDDGAGVPEESIDKLFDVFYRSDASRKNPSDGSGLGLAIAEKTIERFGGTIHAENAAAGGLTIVITLPKSGDGA